MQMRFGEGRLFVENGQQLKLDFMPALSSIILNCKYPYLLRIIDTTELLDSKTMIVDVGLVEPAM